MSPDIETQMIWQEIFSSTIQAVLIQKKIQYPNNKDAIFLGSLTTMIFLKLSLT